MSRGATSNPEPKALTALCVRYVPTRSLTPNRSNPRQHSAQQIRQIAASITTFGFLVPILVDGAGRVLAGHGRLQAARELGLSEVPTISVDHLSDAQRKAFTIADNRLTEVSTWDKALLREQFLELSAADLDFTLDVTGFDVPAIDLIVQGEMLATGDDPDDALLPPAPPVSRLGDVWHLGDHRIVCGSALDPATYDALMGSERAALVFCDPPYNVPIVGHVSGHGKKVHRGFVQASGEMSRRDFTDFLRSSYRLLVRYSEDGSLHYICSDWRHAAEFLEASEGVYASVLNCCVWNKGSGGMGSLYRSQHELVWVFKAGKGAHTNNVQLGRYGRTRTNVWTYPGINSFARSTDEGNLLDLHPTVKPVQLVADAILDTSRRGDIVLDAFLGSGTTIIAAERTGRIGRGIELDAAFVDVAVRRWQRLTKRSAVHAALRCTFDELEEARFGGDHG